MLGIADFSEPIATSDGEILLAEFAISVDGDIGATVELEPATLGESFAANVGFNTGVDFDAGAVNTFATTITVVPEPETALTGLSLLALHSLGGRRQKYR